MEEAANQIVKVEDLGRWKANDPEQKHNRRVENAAQAHSYVDNDIMDQEEDYPQDREH